MVRTNLKQIKKYFKCFESKNNWSCTLGKCKAVIEGNHASNLERHVKRFHDKKYKEFHNEKQSALQQRACASSPNKPQKKRMRETNQCAIDEMLSKMIQIKMNKKALAPNSELLATLTLEVAPLPNHCHSLLGLLRHVYLHCAI